MLSGISHSSASLFSGVFQFSQTEKENSLFTSAATSQTTPRILESFGLNSSDASSNVLSGNFVSADRQQSRYMKATMAGFQSDNNMANRQSAILSAGLTELNSLGDDADNYSRRMQVGRKAARSMRQEQDQSVSEEFEKNFEDIKEDIEKRAQEANAPKDENGKPILTDKNGVPVSAAESGTPLEPASTSLDETSTESVGEAVALPGASASSMEMASASLAYTASSISAPAPSTSSVDVMV